MINCTLQVSSGTEEEVKNKAESLWEAVATGNAALELTPKYFPPEQTKIILSDLQYKIQTSRNKAFCDTIIKNKKGFYAAFNAAENLAIN